MQMLAMVWFYYLIIRDEVGPEPFYFPVLVSVSNISVFGPSVDLSNVCSSVVLDITFWSGTHHHPLASVLLLRVLILV